MNSTEQPGYQLRRRWVWMARDNQSDGTSKLWRLIKSFLLIFRPGVYMIISHWLMKFCMMKFCIRINTHQKTWGTKAKQRPQVAICNNQLSLNIFLKFKMGSKDNASPHASFILTRKYFFIISFTSIYNLLSRYSNKRNLNLCLPNKYLLGGLIF